jgi:hypothetical protein
MGPADLQPRYKYDFYIKRDNTFVVDGREFTNTLEWPENLNEVDSCYVKGNIFEIDLIRDGVNLRYLATPEQMHYVDDSFAFAEASYKNYEQTVLYKDLRKDEYPSIGEQLDMLYHDIKNENLIGGSWINAIETVKQSFPKPEE